MTKIEHDGTILGGGTMPIITVLIILILIGVGLYLVNTLIPMDSKIKTIINVVAILLVVLWLLEVFGLFDSFGMVPRVHHRY